MRPKPPLLSGRKIVKALQRLGYHRVSQKGSHIKLYHPQKESTLIIPDHQEVDRWTLKGILKDAELTIEEFLNAL